MLISVQPVLPAVLAVVVLTLAVFFVLFFQSNHLWVNQKRFRWVGIFFELTKAEAVRLACLWLKLALLIVYLIMFEPLTMTGYLLIVVPGLIHALWPKNIKKIPSRLLWLVVEMIGLISANLVCGFYQDTNAGAAMLVIYIFMSLFIALFGCYLFLTELNEISEGRSVQIHE